MICENCGKEWPDTLAQPIRCLCQPLKISREIKKIEHDNNNPKARLEELERRHEESRILRFRKLWEYLHSYKWQSEEETRKWFDGWCAGIPCGSCKHDWFIIIRNFPPDFSSAQAFFEWSVAAHNLVNKKLDKPELSLEEAIKIWQ